MINVDIPIAIADTKSRILRPKQSTTRVEIYVDTTAIIPIIIVDVFDFIVLPVT